MTETDSHVLAGRKFHQTWALSSLGTGSRLVRFEIHCDKSMSSSFMQTEDPELVKLITNEIDIGFTFMETHGLSSSADHAAQALSSAKAALETAERFLERLSEKEAAAFRPDLRRLRNVIDGASQ